MATMKFHKVTTLPGSLDADAIYLVQNGTIAETYATNSAGVARSVGNSAMINSLADARIALALANLNSIEIVADITARNVLAALDRNLMVLVQDATGDATVASGAAMYAFRNADNTWIKLTEYESLDVVVAWSSISGKPASAPALIDDAVSKRHAHSNAAYLDKIGEASGAMTYDGQPIGMAWSTTNW